MIGFNALGHLGRLGNQMFQFAALKGIARNRGYEYCLPPSNSTTEWKDHHQYYHAVGQGAAQHLLLQPFKLSNTSQLNLQYIDKKRPVVQEGSFTFNEDLFNNCPDWVDLQGFFQTEKYFKHIRDELKKDFEFRDDISIPCKEMMAEIQEPVSLHIRRTDYITNPNHSALDLGYYEKALKQFDRTSTIVVFSDDPDWCNEQELFASDRFLVAEENSAYVDLCLMTLCKGHIIANSSFSWWGAWLSDSELVVAPEDWFRGSENADKDTSDITPKSWMRI
mgnify:FL=1|tara:strand:- start:1063 stop:1896 length:834 start_codon:yes stop_codon:yes gene_type:complete